MYTAERNIQIVIALLKANNIRKVVVSPGSMNFTFIASIQNDADFDLYSCTDERSAAYMACGMSAETGDPVVLSCTGATASRDYMPALTEAYYRKLQILAITSLSNRNNVGQLIGQQIDRSVQPKDIVVESVYLPPIKDKYDEQACIRDANKAILALKFNGGGPVHIDMSCSDMSSINVEKLPSARVIRRYTNIDDFPVMPEGRIAVMLGAHAKFDEKLTKVVDKFCATYDAIVISVNPKSYNGEFAANASLLFSQVNYAGELNKLDLCIHIGEVNTDAIGFFLYPNEVWRVNEDGIIKDRYGALTKMFQMTDYEFFYHYAKEGMNRRTYLENFLRADQELRENIPELPFSNAWISQVMAPIMPIEGEIHLGILNTLRMWDYTNPSPRLRTNANTGGYGIDGCLSTMIGASIVSPQKEFYGIFGDLAFFYDMTILGNRYVGTNVHIMLINNDGGQQFRNFDHPASSLGSGADPFVASAGHFGPKSRNLVKHFVEDLGFIYLKASTKEEFEDILPMWLEKGKPVIAEIFIDGNDDGEAVKILRNILPTGGGGILKAAKRKIVNTLGNDKINAIKVLLGKKV